jgi:septum formation protein
VTTAPGRERSVIVLASASPRRRDLLTAAGIGFDVDPAAVDERPRADEPPETYARRVAIDKAQTTARRHPDRAVLAADTIVVIDERVLGKPTDAHDAAGMLRALSNRSHVVMTAVALVHQGRVHAIVDRTIVWMREMSAEEIAAYVATGEPLDKAGAYAIQGGAGAFVERIEGSVDTVIGLPVARTRALLAELNLDPVG